MGITIKSSYVKTATNGINDCLKRSSAKLNFKKYRYRIPDRKKRIFVIILSIILYFVFLPFTFIVGKKKIRKEFIKNILIIRNDGIGDFILSLPALQLIRRIFPQTRITLFTGHWQTELAVCSRLFDEIIEFGDNEKDYFLHPQRTKYLFFDMLKHIPFLRKKNFDIAIDMRGDFRNRIILWLSGIKYRLSFDIGGMEFLLTQQIPYREGIHEVEHFLDLVNPFFHPVSTQTKEFNLFIPDSDKMKVNIFLKNRDINLKEHYLIIVHPISRWPVKEWSKINFARLCDKLLSNINIKIILIGSKEDLFSIRMISKMMEITPIVAAGEFNLIQTAYLISRANLFIGNDAAPMHIAAFFGIPVIALFGPTDPAIFGPYGEGHTVFRKFNIEKNHKGWSFQTNPNKFCMDKISVDEVFNCVKQYLNKSNIKNEQ